MFGHKERKIPFKHEPDEELEALRDDCIALFINSGLTREEIHRRGGPTSPTLGKWLYKETLFPRLATIQSFVRALGYKLVISNGIPAGTDLTKEGSLEHLILRNATIRTKSGALPARKISPPNLRTH